MSKNVTDIFALIEGECKSMKFRGEEFKALLKDVLKFKDVTLTDINERTIFHYIVEDISQKKFDKKSDLHSKIDILKKIRAQVNDQTLNEVDIEGKTILNIASSSVHEEISWALIQDYPPNFVQLSFERSPYELINDINDYSHISEQSIQHSLSKQNNDLTGDIFHFDKITQANTDLKIGSRILTGEVSNFAHIDCLNIA
jgi:5-methylcytosine-specific restriction endonuclease McrBC GTP-binding regulatory subunit McrB